MSDLSVPTLIIIALSVFNTITTIRAVLYTSEARRAHARERQAYRETITLLTAELARLGLDIGDPFQTSPQPRR